MNRDGLVFIAAFLLGFLVLSSVELSSRVEESDALILDQMRASSSRLDHSFSEYEAAILNDEEKLQLLLDQANTLSSLLGLAEKLADEDSYNEKGLMMVATKLASLYPMESIDFYSRSPTNAAMNRDMESQIIKSWAACDLSACLAYLDMDETRSIIEYCEQWTELVYQEWPEKSSEILISFSQMSRDKQNTLLQNRYVTVNDEILEFLLSELKDQQLRSTMEARLRFIQEKQLAEKTERQAQHKIPYDVEQGIYSAMIRDIKERNLPPETVATMLGDVKSRKNRMFILYNILERRMDDQETPDAWLVRVSEMLAGVNEIPDSTPRHSGKGVDPSRDALQAWLPKQSIQLQRAWADDVVNQMHGEDAMEWIDTLSQASLRADLRDQHLEQWVRNSPAEAAGYIVEKASAFEQEDYLSTAVYRWALQDYAAAKQWTEAQADSPAKAAAMKKLEPSQ